MREGQPHTVTGATQNEALLWKIEVLEMKKALCWLFCWCRNILPLAHTGNFPSSMLEISPVSVARPSPC